MRILASVYNGFLLAMAVTITLFGVTWLEMRVNMAYILLGCWLLMAAALYLLSRLKKWRVALWFTAANTAVCTGYGLLLLGPKRFLVVPAAIIREGLGMRKIPFGTINTALLVGLLAVFVALCAGEWAAKRKTRRAGTSANPKQ